MKMLKSTLTLLLFTALLAFNSYAQIPTDTASLPYVTSEMVELIQNGFEEPTEENEYVILMLEEPDFPQIEVGKDVSNSSLKSITKWVQSHPASIEKLLINRKKYFDKNQ